MNQNALEVLQRFIVVKIYGFHNGKQPFSFNHIDITLFCNLYVMLSNFINWLYRSCFRFKMTNRRKFTQFFFNTFQHRVHTVTNCCHNRIKFIPLLCYKFLKFCNLFIRCQVCFVSYHNHRALSQFRIEFLKLLINHVEIFFWVSSLTA